MQPPPPPRDSRPVPTDGTYPSTVQRRRRPRRNRGRTPYSRPLPRNSPHQPDQNSQRYHDLHTQPQAPQRAIADIPVPIPTPKSRWPADPPAYNPPLRPSISRNEYYGTKFAASTTAELAGLGLQSMRYEFPKRPSFTPPQNPSGYQPLPHSAGVNFSTIRGRRRQQVTQVDQRPRPPGEFAGSEAWTGAESTPSSSKGSLGIEQPHGHESPAVQPAFSTRQNQSDRNQRQYRARAIQSDILGDLAAWEPGVCELSAEARSMSLSAVSHAQSLPQKGKSPPRLQASDAPRFLESLDAALSVTTAQTNNTTEAEDLPVRTSPKTSLPPKVEPDESGFDHGDNTHIKVEPGSHLSLPAPHSNHRRGPVYVFGNWTYSEEPPKASRKDPSTAANPRAKYVYDNHRTWEQTAQDFGWPQQIDRLQAFILSPRFRPHWLEFCHAWLDTPAIAAGSHIGPNEATLLNYAAGMWDGRTDTHTARAPLPVDKWGWDRALGLGHHVRLLSLVVEDCVADGGIWAPVPRWEIVGYLRRVYAVVRMMKADWGRKGRMYGAMHAAGDPFAVARQAPQADGPSSEEKRAREAVWPKGSEAARGKSWRLKG